MGCNAIRTWMRAAGTLGLALVVTAMLAAAGVPSALATSAAREPVDSLGERVCASYSAACIAMWRAGMARGLGLTRIAVAACAQVRARDGELSGMYCLEAVIAELAAGAAGEEPSGQGAGIDPQGPRVSLGDLSWRSRVAAHFAELPAHCDQATPVIYEYFDCLAEGVLFYESIVKARQMY